MSMDDQTVFPSEGWFVQLASTMATREEEYRKLGPMDYTMVVKVGYDDAPDRFFEVAFEAHAASSVREIKSLDDAHGDHFVINASLGTWRTMIENIRKFRGADLEHTLNYLTFPDDPMEVSGPDQLQTDNFYRYVRSIQEFFNGAAVVETGYA